MFNLRVLTSPGKASLGMAVVRIWTAAVLFLRHGWEKRPSEWAHFMAHFPDPIHLGAHLSFLCAFTGDFLCPLLLLVGLAGRYAALVSFCNVLVAWVFVHHMQFLDKAPGSDHGELIVLYLGSLAAIVAGGSGSISLDNRLAQQARYEA